MSSLSHYVAVIIASSTAVAMRLMVAKGGG
jgi:hypothetical protein